jgi:Glycosyl transferases group 1
MRVVIANVVKPIPRTIDFRSYWARHIKPPKRQRDSLFDQPHDWGFHIYSLGVYLLDKGIADEVEFWDFAEPRSTEYHSNGILRILFYNEDDVSAYLERFGYPDLFINHGTFGRPLLDLLQGKCFRVHVPALRGGLDLQGNSGAECFLLDSEEFLDERSMMYIPVVNTKAISPIDCEKVRDFVYLAANYGGKRHDIVINAVRGTELTGHFHPVKSHELDLSGTHITTSAFNERDVVEILRTSRIAVYPADHASSPASMWECVAAGLPIVVNEKIRGGRHVVVPGVTGELASENNFLDVMRYTLGNRDRYRPREYYSEHWDTVSTLESYLGFFRRMGWQY